MPDRPDDKGRFTRTGIATYVGLACTVWRYEDSERNAEARVTADRVPLRGFSTRAGQTFGLEAARLTYTPRDSARFRRPDGYEAVRRPASPTKPGR